MTPTRREFLATSAATAAMMMAAREANAQSPNGRINLGVIGCGGRGNGIIKECLEVQDKTNVQFVALCDVWKKNLDSTQARLEKESGTKLKTFSRHQDLLALPEVDAVIIATPDFAHCPVLIDAANAKKHAYCEKPMAKRLEDATGALDAVTSNGVICQVGTQRRSWGQWTAAAKVIQSGALGEVVKCDTSWQDNGPRWKRDYSDVCQEDVDWDQYLLYLPKREFDPRFFRLWHLYRELSVGLVGLLGSHLIDVATWFMEDPLPKSCTGMGALQVWKEREHYDHEQILYEYPKGFLLQWSSTLANSNFPAENTFLGTRGTFDTKTWTLRGDGGGEDKIAEPLKIEAEEVTTHVEDWVQCIRDNNPKTRADIHAGYAHSIASIMGAMACRDGKRYVYEHENRAIVEG
jgi:predicted dehydrogenase